MIPKMTVDYFRGERSTNGRLSYLKLVTPVSRSFPIAFDWVCVCVEKQELKTSVTVIRLNE